MEKSRRLKKSLMLFMRGGITLLVALVFYMVWKEYYQDFIALPFYRKGNWVLALLYMFLYHLFTNLYGGYRIGTERLTDIIYSNWLSLFIVNVVTYVQICLLARGFLEVAPFFYMTLAQAAIIFIWGFFINRIYFSLFPPLKLLCLYDGKYPSWLIKKFSNRAEKFEITQAVKLENCHMEYAVKLAEIDGVLIYNISEEKTALILKNCVNMKKRFYVVPSLSNILLTTSKIIYLFDLPILMAKNQGLSPEQRVLKRMMDIVISCLILIPGLFIMLPAALAIKLSDGGPVFYTQDRCTRDGKIFKIYKFRSMKENAEADGIARIAEENDPRITTVGRILRKFRVDELPQLFNILRGEMSFVGPRPERPEIIEEYKMTVPEFDQRLNVKCGLTGFAQVMGSYSTPPEEKLKLDLIYIQKYSILLDVKIILMTLKILVMNEEKAR